MSGANRLRSHNFSSVPPFIPGVVFLSIFLIRASFQHETVSFTLFDDAMISMTYAKTLVQTGEWTWFAGSDRVQGFTNPLWTAYMALLHLVGLHGSSAALAISLTSAVFVLICGVLVAYLVYSTLPTSTKNRDFCAGIAGGTVLLLYPLVYWSLRGMEVGLLAMLLTAMAVALRQVFKSWQRSQFALGSMIALAVLSVLGVLTRLDFVIIAGATALVLMISAPNYRIRLQTFLLTLGPLLVTVLAIFLFQHFYYGDFLTNTYRLKVEGFTVTDRLMRGLFATLKALPLLAITLISLIAILRKSTSSVNRRLAVWLALTCCLMILYSIWVGGDAWEWTKMLNRYVAFVLPLATALLFSALATLVQPLILSRRSVSLGAVVIVLSGVGAGSLTNPNAFSAFDAGLQVLTLSLPVFALGILLSNGKPGSPLPRTIPVFLSGALLVVAATSALPGILWLRDGPIHAREDALVTHRSMLARDATKPTATIATVWAGAPGYYLERPLVDLLGKSDSFIAQSAPQLLGVVSPANSFLPGHNKWDYEFSLSTYKPDMIFQRVADTTPEDYELFRQLGYVAKCLADGTTVYVLQSSGEILWDRLMTCSSSPTPSDIPN